ncbi:glycosyltransferase family 2 protein [Antarcticibacterium arcticum]|uniref:Glycosyltransferase family 2 protein n=1 Tax=Antarcticibacterium arcticum TaxID=2585771 RepID=A0A5B8YHH5_9FLAO|nr:glycosyltransferase [Antarcticibacterium arcticum]QED37380.1 glycosyltransferase family 2 protein [Antarcticibacterium arcticum]
MFWFDSDVIMYGFLNGYHIFMLVFALSIMSSYIILGTISILSLRKYLKENSFVNYQKILNSEMAPRLSLIAPAYNEGMTIEENVQSLLSLNYNNFEVIVVNDGSRDNTLQLLIKTYGLVAVDSEVAGKIPTKQIIQIYKSRNKAFKKLTVIDKVNGGKADALNVGINFSENPYVVCIDVDCILEKDALLKLAKPYLERSDSRMIATGGVVRIANSCTSDGGRLVKIRAPQKYLPRIQVLEYLRAFLLGRMAWSKLDGLLLISGAFGMFDKEIAIKAGGYNPATVGEDMELVVRMRRYMIENNFKYSVFYIPDPICWTEAPESFKVFKKQRSRWTRGTMETLWAHKKMFLNPKYKILGIISIPYWTFFEYLAPLLEIIGIIVSICLIFFGLISWKLLLLVTVMVYVFAVMISCLALLTEEYTYSQYTRINDFKRLLVAAFIEPFYFHPVTVYAAVLGNWEKIRGKNGWGEMKRSGFKTKTVQQTIIAD